MDAVNQKKQYKSVSPTVTLAIPVLNEEKNLPYVLPGIPDMVDEVLLIDGHSSDNTRAVAGKLCPGARFVVQDGKGKGDALRCAFRESRGDIIVTIDADGSMSPDEIPAFVEALVNGCDFAKGSRFLPGGGTSDMQFYRKLGNWIFVYLVNLIYGSTYTDLCYGYNAFWKDSVKDMTIVSSGFEIETEISVKACRMGLKVAEVPSYEDKRRHGASNLRSIRDGWRIFKTIAKHRSGKVLKRSV